MAEDIRWKVTVENILDRGTARMIAATLRKGADEAGLRVEISGYVVPDNEEGKGDIG